MKTKIKYNPTQLRMGIKIEHEHSKSRRFAMKIAKDHLREFPNYYTYLVKMENKLKKMQKRR